MKETKRGEEKDPRTTQQNVAKKPNTLNLSLLICWGWVYSGSGQSKASMKQVVHLPCNMRFKALPTGTPTLTAHQVLDPSEPLEP